MNYKNEEYIKHKNHIMLYFLSPGSVVSLWCNQNIL